ncbi:MAG: hypothetical protein NTX19_01315 [Gemmatimonadetes bacterium]|nr:hypothetical protein [Gemmatimonadota bacterium]
MTCSPNLYLAALGPMSELLGLVVIVAVFALLRAQADRRTYFRTWEMSWVFFAVALTSGLFYERFIDPESVFFSGGRRDSFPLRRDARRIPVARARVESLLARTASLTVSGIREGLRAERAVSMEGYRGGEGLAEAATAVSRA